MKITTLPAALSLAVTIGLFPAAFSYAEAPAGKAFGFRPHDYDVFDRADPFIRDHNVALAARGTAATVRRGTGEPQPAASANNGTVQEIRANCCILPGTTGVLEFAFEKPTLVRAVRVFSGDLPNNWALPSGECSIRRFRVEGLADGKWSPLGENTAPFAGYRERKESIGPYTHHATLEFPAMRVERLRVVSLESNDTGKRLDPPETAPVEKRFSLVREVEIFSNDPALGPVRLPLKRLVETEWSLPVYLDNPAATLVVLPRPWLDTTAELEVSFRERTTGKTPAAPQRLTIRAEEQPQRFPIDIGGWPDGEYVATIREVRTDGAGTGEIRRLLIKQTIPDPQPPQGPIAVKGLSLVPIDDWYFAEKRGLVQKLHPAEQIPVVQEPFTPDRRRIESNWFKRDQNGDFLVEVVDMDRAGGNPERHVLRSKDGITWTREPAPKEKAAATDRGAGRFVRTAALSGDESPRVVLAAAPKPPSGSVGNADDQTAKWRYQGKNAPIAARPHRYYDPEKDGPVDLTKVTIRHARHYPPMWGDIKIEPYTVWPVWEKSPDDYVILLREPLTRHMFGFIDDELPPASAAGDGWFGGVPEISPDKKTIYWNQYRMIQRHPPFRVAYDLPRGTQRHIVIWSSQDGLNWKQNFTTLPTEEDEIGTQHYGGSVKNLEGGRLKLLYQWVYRSARQQMRLELAYSRDGRRWHRLPGPPFADNGPFASWNYGFATDRDFPEIDQDGFSYRLAGRDSSALHFGWETFNRIDYAEITGEYLAKFYDGLGLRQMPNWGDWGSYDALAEYLRTKGCRTIGMLRYRKNGWVSLQPERESQGNLVTKTLTAHELVTLNAKTAAGGSIRVEVLDAAGKPLDKYAGNNAAVFTGDAIDGRLAWSGGAVQTLPDGPFRLRLVLDRADLFAINFPHTSAADAAKAAAANAPRPAGELHVDPVHGDDAGSGPAAAKAESAGPLRSLFTAPEAFASDRIPAAGSP